ncbi:MAG: hypothetical protein ACR2MQ_02245 [Gemmatimonadaceae bacterium]
MREAEPPLPPRIQAYIGAIVGTCAANEQTSERASKHALVSVVLFGSAATGGFSKEYSGTVSDVDLILVVPDDASRDDRLRVRDDVMRLEALHGFRDDSPHPRSSLDAFMRRVTANVRSFFVCTRADLLSGSVARILDLPPQQAIFVDRVVIPSIVGSAVTVWGEDLLPNVQLPPIRRFEVFKAFHGLAGQILLSAAVFPLLPDATKYAMGALKRSVHNCFFCYHGHRASLQEEVDFFQRRLGPSRTLARLLDLRREYRPSFAFVAYCLPALAYLHLRTAMDNRFPRQVHGRERTHTS